jgi:hypothetical protein
MTDPEKERRRAEILAWIKEHPDYEFFQGMPAGDDEADAQAVVGGVFSGIQKLRSAMAEAIPDMRLEDLIEVMFGDAEYWAGISSRGARSSPP